MIEFHRDAKANFDAKSLALISLIQVKRPARKRSSSFEADFHVKHHLTEKDMIEFHPSTISNGFGDEIGFSFYQNGKEYGIVKENYKKVLKLIEQISRQKTFLDKISKETIKSILFDWIQKKFTGSSEQDFTDFLSKRGVASSLLTS